MLLEIKTQAKGKDMKENNKLKLNIQLFVEGDRGSEGEREIWIFKISRF